MMMLIPTVDADLIPGGCAMSALAAFAILHHFPQGIQ